MEVLGRWDNIRLGFEDKGFRSDVVQGFVSKDIFHNFFA